MRRLTENQINVLLPFFKDEGYPGWKTIALNLIKNGNTIVAGNECIWKGGIGNFIRTEKSKNLDDCLEYYFDLEVFLSSVMFQEYKIALINDSIKEVIKIKEKLIEIKQKYDEINIL